MKPCYDFRIALLWILLLIFFRLQGQDVDTLNSKDHKVFSESLIQGSYDDLETTFERYNNDKKVASFYGKAYFLNYIIG